MHKVSKKCIPGCQEKEHKRDHVHSQQLETPVSKALPLPPSLQDEGGWPSFSSRPILSAELLSPSFCPRDVALSVALLPPLPLSPLDRPSPLAACSGFSRFKETHTPGFPGRPPPSLSPSLRAPCKSLSAARCPAPCHPCGLAPAPNLILLHEALPPGHFPVPWSLNPALRLSPPHPPGPGGVFPHRLDPRSTSQAFPPSGSMLALLPLLYLFSPCGFMVWGCVPQTRLVRIPWDTWETPKYPQSYMGQRCIIHISS